MSGKPTVSVIVPTHNRKELLGRALRSLLSQTFQDFEIIVVDDGSTDGTSFFLSSFVDERIVRLRSTIPQGACYARNLGISYAKGEFLTFLDDDDEFLPTRIEAMLRCWDDKWAYVCTGRLYITQISRKVFIPKEIVTLDDMLFQITIGNSVLTKTSRVRELGGFDINLASSQDYDLWVRLNRSFGDGYCVQESLLVMHAEHEKHRISVSSRKLQGHFDFYRKHKDIMNYDQRRSKIFELVKHSRKKIGIVRLFHLGKQRKFSEVLKVYLNSRYPFVKIITIKILHVFKKSND